jgi:hypothetical protein
MIQVAQRRFPYFGQQGRHFSQHWQSLARHLPLNMCEAGCQGKPEAGRGGTTCELSQVYSADLQVQVSTYALRVRVSHRITGHDLLRDSVDTISGMPAEIFQPKNLLFRISLPSKSKRIDLENQKLQDSKTYEVVVSSKPRDLG